MGVYWHVELELKEHENKPTIEKIKGDSRTFAAVWDNLKEFNLLFKNLDSITHEVFRNP